MRRANMNDLAAVTQLTVRAYAQHTDALGAPPLPVTEDYAPRIAAGEVWLLEEGGAPIGLIAVEESTDHLHIFSVAVAPDRQSQGLGQRLLAFAEDMAVRSRLPLLTLCTNARMERNIAIYRRFGFIETARRPNPNRPGWTLVDMDKALPAAVDKQRSG